MPATFDLHHVAGLDLRGCDQSRDAVRRAIEELPEDYLNVLLLRDIVEFDTQERRNVFRSIPAPGKRGSTGARPSKSSSSPPSAGEHHERAHQTQAPRIHTTEGALHDHLSRARRVHHGLLGWHNSRRQRIVFRFHLAFCRECRDYLSSYEQAIALGKAVFQHPDEAVPEQIPEDLVRAILAARQRAED